MVRFGSRGTPPSPLPAPREQGLWDTGWVIRGTWLVISYQSWYRVDYSSDWSCFCTQSYPYNIQVVIMKYDIYKSNKVRHRMPKGITHS